MVLCYLCVGDTQLLQVCCQLVNTTAQLLHLLRQRLQHLLLLELGVTLRLVSNGNRAGYWRRVLFVTQYTHTHTLGETKTSRGSSTTLWRCRFLTLVKVNFWVWVKWVPLVMTLSEGPEHLKVCRSSDRSEVADGAPKAPSAGGSAAERRCSSMRLRSLVNFLLRYSCSAAHTHSISTHKYLNVDYCSVQQEVRHSTCGVR